MTTETTEQLWTRAHSHLCAGKFSAARAALDELIRRDDVRDRLGEPEAYGLERTGYGAVLADRIDLVNAHVEARDMITTPHVTRAELVIPAYVPLGHTSRRPMTAAFAARIIVNPSLDYSRDDGDTRHGAAIPALVLSRHGRKIAEVYNAEQADATLREYPDVTIACRS